MTETAAGYRAKSFEELVGNYENTLYRTALAMMKNQADAEDAVQEVFLKVLSKWPEFTSAEHEKAWLLRVLINICKNKLRSVWFRRTVPLLETLPAEDPEQESLIVQVMALPEKYRTVIHLYYYEGYSTREIAEITDQKETTVRSLMSRGREKLKEVLKEEEAEFR